MNIHAVSHVHMRCNEIPCNEYVEIYVCINVFLKRHLAKLTIQSLVIYRDLSMLRLALKRHIYYGLKKEVAPSTAHALGG